MTSYMEPLTAERDGRVADYLDDKLQTIADLSSLDGLLQNVRNQQSLLQQQLEDAQKQLRDVKDESSKHTKVLNSRVAKFEKDQADIDTRMMVVTGSETSDEAVKKFEASMDKLKRLDVAKGYLELLQLTETTSHECLSNLGSDNSKALQEYSKLRKLLNELLPLQDAADGAAPHLLDHIRTTVEQLHKSIEQAFTASLESTLKKISWPKPDAAVSDSLQQEVSTNVSQLLKLQIPDIEQHERKIDETNYLPPLVLLPFSILVKPLELGFRYHFEGDRPTNRLERPEFFLNHVIDRILVKYVDFVSEYIQPILEKSFRGTDLALNYAYLDATSAFITALLPMVRNKISSVLPQVIKKPALLSHLIHELIQFDKTLREEWDYDGGSRTDVWIGLAGEVLNKDDTFTQWLKAERDFALARYHEIVDGSDSFNLDFDSLGSGKTKPTFAAIRVNDLLEAVTDNYRDLATFSHKLRFLLNIQISLFDLFHSRLAEALAAYLARSSTIGRASREDQAQLQGIAGLERLCRIFGSADYLERAMRDWNDDVFFLDLYSVLHHHTQTSPNKPLYESTTADQIVPLTSTALTAETSGQDVPPGALFDETASSYARLRTRTETVITSLLSNAVKSSMGRYVRTTHWASLSPSTQTQTTTPELDPIIETVSALLNFLSRAVGTVPLRRLTLKVLEALNERFMDMVLGQSSSIPESLHIPGAAVAAASSVVGSSHYDGRNVLFSQQGAAQFQVDVKRIANLVAGIVDRDIVDSGMGRIKEAIELLCLPTSGSQQSEEDEESEDEQATIFNMQNKLLGSGESARETLDEMGLSRLGVGEARKIIARRVELGG